MALLARFRRLGGGTSLNNTSMSSRRKVLPKYGLFDYDTL